MPNQLTNRVKPMPPFDEHDLANAAERSQSQLSFAQSETQRQGQQASLPQWFGSQSLQRKYLIGWLASGVLSAVGIAGAGIWFTASVNHIQQADQASTQLSPTEKQSRLEPMLQRASQQQLLAIALVLAANTGVLLLLYRAIAQPVKQLQQDAQMFLLGDQQIRADVKTTDEIGKIARMFNQMADGAVATETLLAEQARQREIEMQQMRLMSQMSSSRVHTLQDLDGIFEQAVEGAKTILAVDRVVVYRFHPDWSGEISAEAVTPGLPSALANTIKDACISANLIEAYRQGRVIATSDVFNAGFDPEHLKLMTTLHIKANLVTPILQGDKLYGLLIAHHCTATHSWNSGEIDFLKEIAIQIGLSLERSTFLEQKEADTDRGQQLYQISSRARRALTSQEIYNITLQGVRETLKTDRAIVYLFDEDWKGTIVAETVGRKYPTALGAAIADPCFAERYVEKYKQGRVQTLEDIDNAGLTECHLAQLAPFQVKASMVAPILAGHRLHGLLITHQCSQTRCWQAVEIEFFKEIAAQLGLSLDQMDVLQQLEQSRQQAEQLLEEQRHQKEALQWQLVTLLDQVEGAASGNLTVRADVTDGELGTVADFFNAIIESLRQIVVEVKRSTTQVNTSLGENEATIQQLAVEALKQSKDITQTLNSVDQMTASIQAVAESAQQAAAVTQTASTTAEASQVAIDFTVHSIFELRETMSETAHKMKRLGESSQAISKVISLINQIALKTNMLALNAGIEAARAGENGLGFAVVAEEVGELAAQSASATQEIEQLVDDIQRETRQVIEAMEQSTVQMVEGTRLVEDAKQNLGHLRQLSQQTDQLVQSISDATVSQTQISQAVTGLMRELAQVSQRTAQSSQQVTDSLQQTVGIAQALQLSVSAFKVEVPDHKLMVI